MDKLNKNESKLTIIGTEGYKYKCLCSCGNTVNLQKSIVRSCKRTTCGKGACSKAVKGKIGDVYGKLTIISYIETEKKYLCLCECGNERKLQLNKLKTRLSCGCNSIGVGKRLASLNYKGKGVSALNRIIKNYKAGAKKRKYEYKLTDEQFSKLIKLPCYYCGVDSSLIWTNDKKIIKEESFKYNGIDRLNNNIGYIEENCVPCCKQCNYAKCKLTYEEWKSWLGRISKNLSNF